MTDTPRPSRRRAGARRRSPATVLAFVLPGLAFYAVFFLTPILNALFNAFFEWRGTARGAFVGLGNFADLFSLEPYASQFGTALAHNATFFVGTMVLQNGAGLLLAFLLNRTLRGKRLFQTIISVPYLMSALVIGYAWSMLLSPRFGVVNALLGTFGVEPVPWLGKPAYVLPILILINAWQWCGVSMLIFGAALAGIPQDQIEAARTDGASGWQIAAKVQLPQMVPALSVVTVLTLIGTLNQFDLVYAIGGTSGGIGGSADMLGTLFYRISFSNSLNAFGLSGALSVVQLILTLALTVGVRLAFDRIDGRYR